MTAPNRSRSRSTRNERPIDQARRLGVCDPAVAWIADRSTATAETIWRECPNGGWLLWLVTRIDVDRCIIAAAACDCVEEVLPSVVNVNNSPRLQAVRRWTNGDITSEDVAAVRFGLGHPVVFGLVDFVVHPRCGLPIIEYFVKDFTAAAAAFYTGAADFDTGRAEALTRAANFIRSRIPWSVVQLALKAS